MYSLRAALDRGYDEAVEATKAGEPVAWCMRIWWLGESILKAMGVVTVYPENFGAVCAAFGAAPAYLERSDAEGFPAHLCGYARNCLGYAARMKDLGEIPPEAPLGGMAKPMLLLGSGALCDSRFKWFQALARYLDTPMWTLEIPHPGVKEGLMPGVYEHNINVMVEQLREFIIFLEDLLGKKMDWDKLDEVVNNTIEINRVRREIHQLRKAKPCPMHSRDVWSSMNPSLYLIGDLKEILSLYHDLYNEVKFRVDNKIGSVAEEKYRLLFAEVPPWHDLKIFDELAERGWNFVVESYGYHPPLPIDYSKISDPVERIARHSYQFFTGYYADALEAGEWWGYFPYPYLVFARQYQCDGAFLHTLLTCRASTNHLMIIQDRLIKKLKVPSLIAEGDIVDLNMFDHADVMMRAEAFEETMEHYQKVRKEEGSEW